MTRTDAAPPRPRVRDSSGYTDAIIRAVHEPIVVLDAGLRVRMANAAFYRSFQVVPSQTEGRLLTELGAGAWVSTALPRMLQEVLSEGTTLEALEVQRDFPLIGRKVMLLNARRIDRADGPEVLLAIDDITGRRTAERSGQENERRFLHVMESLPIAVYTCDTEGRITLFNRAAADLWGREPTLGVDLWCGSWKIYRPDGTPLPLDKCPMAVTLREGRPVRGQEIIIERPDGTRRYVLPFPDPLRDTSGAIVGATNTLLDLTERKSAEDQVRRHRDRLDTLVKDRTAALEESHRRLRLSERLATIGTLSAGLGHDIGNLVLPVRIRLESLAAADLPRDLQDDVKAIRASAEYLQRLANGLRLLALEPERSSADEVTELASWWSDAGPMLKNALPRGIALDVRLPDKPCPAQIGRAALTQAVFNLVQNAGDALRQRGSGRVAVWARRQGESVRIGVTDDGPGMSPEVRAHCMEPYFTTKTRGISTGLGLMLVYGLVKDAGGAVEIDSEEGRGTTFTISLRAGKNADDEPPERPRRALVRLSDPRLQAFVTSELRSLTCDILPDDAVDHDSDLWVVDKLNGTAPPPGTNVVLLAEPSPSMQTGVVALGPRPRPQAIRSALRAAAGRKN